MDVRRLLGTVLLVCAGRSLKSRGVDGEQAVNCTVKKDNFYPPEWLEGHSFIPADLYDLKVELVTTPYLNICWTLSASGSITYLKATFIQLYILEEDMTEEVFGVRCNYRELFKKSKSPNGELWRFCHDTFPLKPNTEYSIRAFNIPVAKITDDQPSKSFHYKSPGCTDPIMMYSESCVPTGIPWNPNITACILEKNVEVNFTAHSPGTEHIIQLHNCLSPSELPSPSCTLIDLYKVTENSKSRISLLINGTTELAYAVVVVYPLLPTCQNDCKRHQKMVDCIHITAPEPAPRTNLPIILLSALFVVCGIAVALYCISKYGGIMPFLVNETGLHPPVRVLLTYPKESAPFLKTVLSFADFLHEYCKADVFLDLWQKRKVADVGQPAPRTNLPIILLSALFVVCGIAVALYCISKYAPEPAPRTNLPIILLSALFVVCGIAVALYCISKYGGIMPFLVNETGLHPPVRVLLTYPKESAPFLKTVLSFADFLHEYCKADVFLDLWQKRKVADVGQPKWESRVDGASSAARPPRDISLQRSAQL
ncbi:hypothetical protein NDU88_007659 [Pleurodeles waltl]|uniref:Uncharacterized protein n=1 Tax=Pleurodeles waltl TaxID=8319 RepID=A0AAV7N431_PLEWA|nr:hypothetical protein NDU88_007659 [Pleurodeles waltl]